MTAPPRVLRIRDFADPSRGGVASCHAPHVDVRRPRDLPASAREGSRWAPRDAPGRPTSGRGGRQKSVEDVVLVDVVVTEEAVELDEVDVLVVLVVVVSQSTSAASTSWQSPHALQRLR